MRQREQESLKENLHAMQESNRWLQNQLEQRNRELLVGMREPEDRPRTD